jgi:hypothetical protein
VPVHISIGIHLFQRWKNTLYDALYRHAAARRITGLYAPDIPSLQYGQELDKKFVTKGDRINFIFSINNEDFFIYPYIKVSFYGSQTIFENQVHVENFSLTPFSGRNYSFELKCNYGVTMR